MCVTLTQSVLSGCSYGNSLRVLLDMESTAQNRTTQITSFSDTLAAKELCRSLARRTEGREGEGLDGDEGYFWFGD